MTKLYICGVCGHAIINNGVCNCPFCGAHTRYVSEFKNESKWRCTVCNSLFEKVSGKCPVCGADSSKFVMIEMDESMGKLSIGDKNNAEKALDIEVSNSTFYFCAAKKTDKEEERKLFSALGKIEFEHAEIWQRILGLKSLPKSNDGCVVSSLSNLKEAFRREDAAIKFYGQAAKSSISPRMKLLFVTLVEIESDHLAMSKSRIKQYDLMK